MNLFRPLCGYVLGIALLASGASLAGPAAVPFQARVDADGVQRVTLVGGSHFFRPEHIVARAGPPLEFTLSMEPGIVPHRFVLEAPDGQVLADVDLGETPQRLRLSLTAGDYVFYCPNRLLLFRSHREKGMAGLLEVRE
ncbi:cupredoxin domain-containing protein [Azotobacter armeniacus]